MVLLKWTQFTINIELPFQLKKWKFHLPEVEIAWRTPSSISGQTDSGNRSSAVTGEQHAVKVRKKGAQHNEEVIKKRLGDKEKDH